MMANGNNVDLVGDVTRPCLRANTSSDRIGLKTEVVRALRQQPRTRTTPVEEVLTMTHPTRAFERFWSKVEIAGPDDCWHWTAYVDHAGYGQFYFEDRLRRPHAVSYILANGTIPDGCVIDHTCHNIDISCSGGWGCRHRRCVNPAHLEAVTQSENLRRGRGPQVARERAGRKLHCPNGHPLSGENLYVRESDNSRHCRTCARAATKAWRAANRELNNRRRRERRAARKAINNG